MRKASARNVTKVTTQKSKNALNAQTTAKMTHATAQGIAQNVRKVFGERNAKIIVTPTAPQRHAPKQTEAARAASSRTSARTALSPA